MMGFEVPLEEIVVKNPGFCPAAIVGDDDTLFNPVCFTVSSTLYTSTVEPPLVTTLPSPSEGSTKYDGPHQQPPMG
jgi:hypothetical protein